MTVGMRRIEITPELTSVQSLAKLGLVELGHGVVFNVVVGSHNGHNSFNFKFNAPLRTVRPIKRDHVTTSTAI